MTRIFKQWSIKLKIVYNITDVKMILENSTYNLLLVDAYNKNDNFLNLLKNNKIHTIGLSNLGNNIALSMEKYVNDRINKPIKIMNMYNTIKNFHTCFIENNSLTNTVKNEFNLKIQDFSSSLKLKILVAEDNIVNQKLILNILKKMGHEPFLVENGFLAVEEVKKNKFRRWLLSDLCEFGVKIFVSVPTIHLVIKSLPDLAINLWHQGEV